MFPLDPGFGIYVHWPFCKAKCPYCDFNSHVRERVDHAQWKDALLREIDFYAEKTSGGTVTSIFFGGGTPSLMEPDTVAAVIERIRARWPHAENLEITLEANPTSVEADKFRGFSQAGVNRVSLGVQSLNDSDLKALGRQHSAREALAAVELAAKYFTRYSFDLIYARPDQDVAAWRQELAQALSHGPTHLSLYQLTIEPGTAFFTLHQRGELKTPDNDTAADLYEATQEMMTDAGMPSYEISNHARPGEESRHNLTYWRYGDYAGIGPGAHGRLTVDGKKYATRAHRAPEEWLKRVCEYGHGGHEWEGIPVREQMMEMLMMGLRLNEGVALNRFDEKLIDKTRLAQMVREGFVLPANDRIALTAAGRQRLDSVMGAILA